MGPKIHVTIVCCSDGGRYNDACSASRAERSRRVTPEVCMRVSGHVRLSITFSPTTIAPPSSMTFLAHSLSNLSDNFSSFVQ
jgi:hypothetical protein